jgi:hypothetical protein
VLMSKIIFFTKKKKHDFDTFPSEKHFEKKPLPQCQTASIRGFNFRQ